MRIKLAVCVSLSIFTCSAIAQRNLQANNGEKYHYGKNLPIKVLAHVRVIDGTGAPAMEDQTIVVEGDNRC